MERRNILRILVLAIAVLAAGQSAWAQANSAGGSQLQYTGTDAIPAHKAYYVQ